MLSKARLYAHTFYHLKPWQIVGRLVARWRHRFWIGDLPEPPQTLERVLQPAIPFQHHDPWNDRRDLLDGRFCFLNQTEHLGWPVNWQPIHLPLLWQFNLHYFHYLHLLEPEEQIVLCNNWINQNPVGRGVGWHPYPTALRIVNWCRSPLDEASFHESLYHQAAHLYRNLETYIYGNHLLENARALVVAGSYFKEQGEASQWLEKGLSLFVEETKEQILSDGGHYERSPMYHALMLEVYLDVINCLPEDHPQRKTLCDTAARMSDTLHSFMHPDNSLPLFNDATLEIALAPDILLNYAQKLIGREPQQEKSFPDTGYFIHRDEEVFLIIDGGPVGPDYLMAHAHADVFSYEFSLGGLPFVVDTGVYEYQAGEMRDYVRSTVAHNTLTVDGVDQVECWSSFRVARRFVPHDVSFSSDEDGSHFQGVFSGYASLIGDDIRHARSLKVNRKLRQIHVEDRVGGRGEHLIESRIHLHPDVTVAEEGHSLLLQRNGKSCRVEVEASTFHWEAGWYCPQFGMKLKTKVLVMGGSSPLPLRLAYRIDY